MHYVLREADPATVHFWGPTFLDSILQQVGTSADPGVASSGAASMSEEAEGIWALRRKMSTWSTRAYYRKSSPVELKELR